MTSRGRLISVITPVSRPHMLPLIQHSVPIEAEWVLVTDGPCALPNGLRSHVVAVGPRTGGWGDAQRAIGLALASRPLVYFLDDDNVMLPHLADLAAAYCETWTSRPSGLLFGLIARYFGETHVWPVPERILPSRVDTAMFLGRREAALAVGWPDFHGARGADHAFLAAFEKRFGILRAPAFWGFHNGLELLQSCHSTAYESLAECSRQAAPALERVITAALDRHIRPAWYKGDV